MWRHHLFQNVAYDTLTIRNNASQEALPMRQLGSFLLGTGVGGAGVHWNGQIWRFLPTDFLARSHNEQRYGKQAVTDYDLTVQDWGVTYDELEPHYDTFDKLCGTSGKAGNLNGADPAGRQSVRGRALERISQPADGADLRRRRCSPRPPRSSAIIRSRIRRQHVAAPTPIRSARSWAPAPTAASARSSAAATIPRRARRRRSCPS